MPLTLGIFFLCMTLLMGIATGANEKNSNFSSTNSSNVTSPQIVSDKSDLTPTEIKRHIESLDVLRQQLDEVSTQARNKLTSIQTEKSDNLTDNLTELEKEKPEQEPKISEKEQESGLRNLDIPDVFHVWPESKTFIPISKVDLNRIVCEKGKVVGRFFSRDKGIVVQKAGKNLFLRVIPDSYAFKHPFELFVVCGDEKGYENTYTLILKAELISSRTIILHPSEFDDKKIKEFFTHPRTERIVSLVKAAYHETFPEFINVKKVKIDLDPKNYMFPSDLIPYLTMSVYLIGEAGPWEVQLIAVKIKNSSPQKYVFLDPSFFVAEDVIAVSVFDEAPQRGTMAKVVIIREKNM